MSFFDPIRMELDRFLRRIGGEDAARGEAAGSADRSPPGEAAPRTERADPTRPRMDALPDPDAAYAFGVAYGRREVEPEHFRRYLEHSVEEQELEARLADLDERERALAAQLEDVRGERAESASRAAAAEELPERIAAAEERLVTVEAELEAAERERKEIRKLGLLSYTLIFGAAAVAFILADVVITRTIVADALALTGRDLLGLDEAWYLAAALAGLAVLLKPAYDRLVEARYWEGDRRWFTVAILGASALALATLAVLGIFRALAYQAQTLGELALEAPGADAADQWTTLRDLQETIVTSGWGQAAFTLSGVLFAVAGAICLGIGLRHFHDFRHLRRPIGRRLEALAKERKRLREALAADAAALSDARARLRRAEVRLEDLPSAARLAENIEAVREQRQTLLERRAHVRRSRLESVYSDGYGMGLQLEEPGPPGERARRRGDPPRPYVAVRRSIRTSLDRASAQGGDPDA